MLSSEIIGTTSSTYNIKESLFIENQEIKIMCGNSNLNVESCLFLKCNKDAGSSIFFSGTNDNVNMNKTCGKSCFLTKSDSYAIFYQFDANIIIDQVSYYDHTSTINSRDLIDNGSGNEFFEHVNISHVNNYLRGFSWFNLGDGKSLLFNYGIAFNITSKCELVQIYSGVPVFNYLCMVSCTQLSSSSTFAVGNYLFASRVDFTMCHCLIRNNKYTALFNGVPKLYSCDIEAISANSLSSSLIDMNPKYEIFLNTFLCKASGIRKCIKTRCISNAQKNHFFVVFIIISTYLSY